MVEVPDDAPQKIEIVGRNDFERNNQIDLFGVNSPSLIQYSTVRNKE